MANCMPVLLALALATTLLVTNPGVSRANTLREAATTAFHNNDHDTAYKLLTTLVTQSNTRTQDFLFKGLIERKKGDLNAAQRSFQHGLNRDPSSFPLLMELAITCAWNNQHHNAIALYEQALRAADPPQRTTAQLGKARVLGWMGQHDKAIELYRAILAQNPR